MDLSIIIPARNEEFLKQTIDNVLKNIQADTEIIAILDGYWPERGIPLHPRVTLIHHEESVGQRAGVNQGAKLSRAQYVMKLDAHCAVDKGFDVKLMADCEPDWTVIPRMYNLHAFDWKCKKCGHQWYQGASPVKCENFDWECNACGHVWPQSYEPVLMPKKCENKKCKNTTDFTETNRRCDNITEFEKVIIWKPRPKKVSDFWRFDNDMKFQYWRAYGKRPEAGGDIADVMSSIGACFFMHRDRFFELGGMDENHGSWGQFGTEIACKSWLSGGRHVVNKKTWFAHMFRTSKRFGFPYPISGKQVKKARKHSQKLWLGNSWPKAKHDLQWLIDKFAPVPDWDDGSQRTEDLSKGLVYYTDNRCEERIAQVCRNHLKTIGLPIVSVSHFPVHDFGENIVMPNLPRSILSQCKQILAGLKKMDTDIVFLVEHDILYHPSHFNFVPPEDDKFYYNQNRWPVCAKTGQALFYYTKALSHCCAFRDLLIEHYEKRVEVIEKEGYRSSMGHSPGSRKDAGFGAHGTGVWFSEHPNIDIRHSNNYTKNRFKIEQFRRKPKGFNLADEVPFWGKTKGRFDKFICEVNERGPQK